MLKSFFTAASILLLFSLSACTNTHRIKPSALSKLTPAQQEGRDHSYVIRPPGVRLDGLAHMRFIVRGGQRSPWFEASDVMRLSQGYQAQREIPPEAVDIIFVKGASPEVVTAIKQLKLPRTPIIKGGQTEDELIIEVGPYLKLLLGHVIKEAAKAQAQTESICLHAILELNDPSCTVSVADDGSICRFVDALPPEQREAVLRRHQQAQAKARSQGQATSEKPPEWDCPERLDDSKLGQWSGLSTSWGMYRHPSNAINFHRAYVTNEAYAVYLHEEIEAVEIYQADTAALAPLVLITGGLAALSTPFRVLRYPDDEPPTTTLSPEQILSRTKLPIGRFEQVVKDSDGADALIDLHLQTSFGAGLDLATAGQLYVGFAWLGALEIGGGVAAFAPKAQALRWTGLFRFTGRAELDAAKRAALYSGVELTGQYWRLRWGLEYNLWDDVIIGADLLNPLWAGDDDTRWYSALTLGLRF